MRTNINVEAATHSPLVFHLTGRRQGAELEAFDANASRPALFARYRDLNALRYDFPLVLIAGADGGAVEPLSRVIDRLLQNIAPPGIESERLRKLVLRVEREIRTLAEHGATGLLSELWDSAAIALPKTAGHGADTVKIARAALDVDGDVVDCDAATARHVIEHLWSAVQQEKTKRFRALAGPLAVKLEDILRADFARSEAGRGADRLSASIGAPHHGLFDFAAMARLLPKASAGDSLDPARRRRIERVLAVITGQHFFAMSSGYVPPRRAPYSFRFESCAAALLSYHARLREMAELVKALAIGELEADGRYVESRHDELFAGFDAESLRAEDLAMFPDYLVTLEEGGEASEAGLIEALSSGAPLKILVNLHDLGAAAPGEAAPAPHGLRGAQLAGLATGLDGVFVVQATSASLYRMRRHVRRGLEYAGPALFCVFSGPKAADASLPPYLVAAAALESRAFPCFTYDAAGPDLAARFSLDGNPQPERDWPLHRLDYADADGARIIQEVAFTAVDFFACDPRNARHFARLAPSHVGERLVPAAARTNGTGAGAREGVPFVLAVDGDGALARLIVDDALLLAARRCLDGWHRLQELGGVHNSHAARLLAREKAEWEKAKRAELDSLKAAATPPVAPPPAPATVPMAEPLPAAAPAPAAEPERSPDEPYIETARCSSCNECIQINDRMFAYNENKQAVIADLAAGPYRQLVEAAESCQLSIIHPGKPRDPSESGLVELIERGAPFA
jgi:hypothetical protein